MTQEYQFEVDIPEGIEVQVVDNHIIVKGKKGELKKEIQNPRVLVKKENNQILLQLKSGLKKSQRDKMYISSYQAHIKNMIEGVIHGYNAKLKICSGHFPMTASIEGNKFSLKNFLGEKVPRTLMIKNGVKVEVQGDSVTVTGLDKDLVGQTAGSLEQLTRITNKDRRIFQDGIYILKKPGEEQ